MKEARCNKITQFALFIGVAISLGAGATHIRARSVESAAAKLMAARNDSSTDGQADRLPIPAPVGSLLPPQFSKTLALQVRTALYAYLAHDAIKTSAEQSNLVGIVSVTPIQSGPYPYLVMANIETAGRTSRKGYMIDPVAGKVLDASRITTSQLDSAR